MPTVVRKSRKSERRNGSNLAIVMAFIGLSLILALASFHPEDPSLNTLSSSWKEPKNVLGYFGSWSADLLFQALGYAAWLVPFLFGASVIKWLNFEDRAQPPASKRDALALCCVLFAATLALQILVASSQQHFFPHAGLLGIALTGITLPFLGKAGTLILATALLWAFSLLWWEDLPIILFHALRSALRFAAIRVLNLSRWTLERGSKKMVPSIAVESVAAPKTSWRQIYSARILEKLDLLKLRIAKATAKDSLKDKDPTENAPPIEAAELDEKAAAIETDLLTKNPTIRQGDEGEAPARKIREKMTKASRPAPSEWTLPPIGMLEGPKTKIKGPTEQQLFDTAEKIRSALESFDIQGEVVEISPGPIITMYEFQPAPGVRVSKLMSASTDLAMTLGVPSVRIVAPIPGKSVAGIEVPNLVKEEIVLRDVYEKTMEKAKAMKVPLVMGKDGEGTPVIEDLSRMPHLLIGGATNMGKSVLVNSLLTGLLVRFSPKDLRLIVVDPKLVEFKIFEDLPHLMLPIVNDPSDASQALKWAVAETKRRYLEMQKVSAKNLEAFNKKIGEDNPEAKLPYIVIVIDELAELMLTAKKDVEQSIVRLSQLARAAGIHLMMATQRPSADVVTGLIKSNCPSRAALRVASASDSRIILDCSGAEQLLGKGDMFFTSTGPMGLRRIQGCFVSDEEIEKICEFWRAQGEPEYLEEILAPDVEEEIDFSNEETDPLFDDVVEFAKEKGKVSTSLIQRRFQIGYTRAARIMDQLEARGIVGDQAAAGKPRDVII
jgi:DNA segregation ATPase FtsK/SpoIIIE, S-DNA-T family